MDSIVIILLLLIVRNGISFINSTSNQNTQLIQLAEKIYKEECQLCKNLQVFFTEEETLSNTFLAKVSKLNPKMSVRTILLRNYTIEEKYHSEEIPDMIFFFLDANNYNLTILVYELEEWPLWNIRVKHLFVVQGIEEEMYDAYVRESFEALWYKQALRAIICFEINNDIKIFSYNPFKNEFIIDITNKKKDIYINRITNMYGHVIKIYNMDLVTTDVFLSRITDGKTEYYGCDGKIFGTLAIVLNASLEIHNMTEEITENMMSDGRDKRNSVQDILKFFRDIYDFDILGNQIKILPNLGVDLVFFLGRDDFRLVIPRGKMIPRYLYLFTLMPINIWLPIILAFILVTLVMSLIRKYHLSRGEFDVVLMDNIRIMLSTSTPGRQRIFEEIFILILWMFFCLILDSAFNSMLMSTLVKPKYYRDVTCLEEVYEHDIKVYGPIYPLEVCRMLVDDVRFNKQTVEIPNLKFYGTDLKWLKNYRNEAFIITNFQKQLLKSVDKIFGRVPYIVLPESIAYRTLAYVVPKNKLYFREFQEVIRRLEESGIYPLWKKYNFGIEKSHYDFGIEYTHSGLGKQQVLSLSHLQSAFLLLICGYILSLVVFILEKIIYNVYLRKLRNRFIH